MRHGCRFINCVFVVAVAMTALGCGGGSAERASNISGTVTFNGNPVPRGNIQFRPAGAEGGVAGYADIVDGKFNTAEAGKGVNGGSYTVLITGFDGNANPDAELPLGQPLFPEFKTTIEVPAGEDVVQDFTVQPQTD